MLYFYYLWNFLTPFVRVFGPLVYLTQMGSYSYTAFSNPGIVLRKITPLDMKNFSSTKKNYRICSICNVIMDMDTETSHCEDCNLCIEGHDHHCPWTSKCIGKRNLKSFYMFVAFSFALLGTLFFGLLTMNDSSFHGNVKK
jgi:hypothetical protein